MIAESHLPNQMPVIFKAEAVGGCPKVLISPFAVQVAKMTSWWETGQLGLNLVTAPMWVDEAITVYKNASNRASQFKMKERMADRTK
jgi:hypothetical protein